MNLFNKDLFIVNLNDKYSILMNLYNNDLVFMNTYNRDSAFMNLFDKDSVLMNLYNRESVFKISPMKIRSSMSYQQKTKQKLKLISCLRELVRIQISVLANPHGDSIATVRGVRVKVTPAPTAIAWLNQSSCSKRTLPTTLPPPLE